MVGRNAGYVTTQGEIVAELLSKAGYSVISVSHLTNRYLRLLHIVVALLWRCKKIDIQCLQVFGGPSFVVEDIASGIAKLCRKPIVMFLHGGAMPEFMARYPRWSRRVLNRADVIVTPSEYLARAI